MSETAARVDAVRSVLRARGLDALYVTHPSNRQYLTGFTADDIPPNESSGHLIVTHSAAVLLTGSVNVTQAEAQAPHVRVVRRDGGWGKAAAALLAELGVAKVGYESEAMLDAVLRGINTSLSENGRTVEWSPSDGIVEELRRVKSPVEVELLRKAFEITNAAFERVAPTIRAGETEQAVAWRLHSAMVELGAEGPSFPIIVAAGTHAARPHHEPGDRRIAEGEPIVIDMGARYHGYCADLTRTVWVGEPDPKLREVYPVVAAAVETVLERAHPGVSCKDMDGWARDYITERGFGEEFSHGLGHGVGVRVHEAPSAHKESKDTLQPGNTITIEPGVYLPDWGGVRVEDVILVTEDGFEVLTTAPKMSIEG